jgi:rare lipoprotein A
MKKTDTTERQKSTGARIYCCLHRYLHHHWYRYLHRYLFSRWQLGLCAVCILVFGRAAACGPRVGPKRKPQAVAHQNETRQHRRPQRHAARRKPGTAHRTRRGRSGCAQNETPSPHTQTRPAEQRAADTAHPRPRARAGANAKPAKKFVQLGKATWYGRRHHGGPTASGERFNMHAMTAAHKKLPFGTRVRVTRLATGRSVIVRINDRGPYGKGRIIDLSRKAAARLGMLKAGVVRVRIAVVRWGKGRRVRSRRRKRRSKRRGPQRNKGPKRRYKQGPFGKQGPPLR